MLSPQKPVLTTTWRFTTTWRHLTATLLTGVTLAAAAAFAPVAQAAPNASSSSSDWAQYQKPLLMENKSTLYQRVLSTPGCLLKSDPTARDGSEVPAFSQFYVYAEQGDSYLVGNNATGNIVGYLKKDCSVPWKQQLAMLFTNPANRMRALIFDEETALDRVIDQDDGADYYKQLYAQVEAGQSAEHVISIEPAEYVDYQKQFYLLPILNSVESMFPDGSYVYKHEIASIVSKDAQNVTTALSSQKSSTASTNAAAHSTNSNSGTQQGNATSGAAAANGADALAVAANGHGDDTSQPNAAIVGFKSAIVFVIDASISMQPYIDRTKQAINSIYKSIEASNLNDSVQFGIVSFRADTKKVPGLEYTAKMYLRPGEAHNAAEFNAKVEQLEQAKVSSAQFDEDSYAGIAMALRDINWNEYGGRYIVLITDAGAIDADDTQSSTGLDANALRLEAEYHGAAIYTLHLLTNAGKKNHSHAQEQYEELSFNRILGKSLYYGVNAGSVQEFGNMVDVLAKSLTSQVRLAAAGELSAGSALAAQDVVETTTKTQEAIVADSRKLGLAMQLAYLGRVKGTQSPEFMQGWLSERDVVDHNQMVCTPIVLVNRNQLSDLYTLVKGVLEAGIAGQLSSDDMFAQLQALAAQMGRDPNLLSESQSIRDMGIMSELLDDLPYKSRIASLTPDDWYNLGSQEQENIVRGLENALNYLQYCSSDSDRFIKLNEEADASEEVYPIPLDALP